MTFTTSDMQTLLAEMAALMAAERDFLCALDGEIGDADHGIAMEKGMSAAAKAAAELQDGTLQDICNAAAKGFLNAVGASSGPLYATAFMRAGKSLGAEASVTLDGLRGVVPAMAEGIAQRGKAERGQKTMLDAWLPAAKAAEAGADPDAIAAAASNGAESTKDMVAVMGRSARLGDRSLGHPDPGAVSAAMIVGLICKRLAAG